MKNINKYPVNLLKSNFEMKGKLKLLQTNIIYFWNEKKIFNRNLLKKKIFILHDGPPFSNGEIHLGHILNKILKDIIIKFKIILNYKTPYIMGWDCFGLPIENKFKNNKNYNYKFIKKYNLIKRYVNYIIKKHKNNFYELGIVSNYNFSYKTINYKNISEEIRVLYNFYKKKYLFMENKFLFWCSKCKSCISNSEIKFILKKDFSLILFFLFIKYNIFLNYFKIKKRYLIGGILVWTTLPWTILANQGLYTDYEKFYIFINTIKGNFIINLQKYIFLKKNNKIYYYKIFLGFYIKKISFLNPIFKINIFFYKKTNIFVKNNLIKNLGTEIIHLAPNYGNDDYKIYKNFYKYKNKLINLFLLNGNFKKKFFYKKNINLLKKDIINYLYYNNKIFIYKKYEHKYMFCSKDNNLVIYISTNQLYLNFKKYKKNLKNIFFSKLSKKIFLNTIKNKPKWNISRQRFWGISIPNIIHKKNETFKLINYISNFYEIYGSKFWYKFKKNNICKIHSIFYKKIYNVLDVWFDSGVTHWTVLRGTHKNILKFPSDLCLEGEDQNRGWFQSSFLISNLLNHKLPFKKIITHNFIKTIYGEKLSKSLNNYINYKNILNYINIDVLRLLICNIKYTKTIILNKILLNNTIDIYRKIRNCMKFILSNISDFNYKIKKPFNYSNKININKYIYSFINFFNKKILLLYNKYNFKKILIKIKKILSEDLSSIYFDLIKNYLYIEILNSKKRKMIQLSLFYLLKNILFLIFPLITFTSEEIWNKIYYKKTIFKKKYTFIKNNKKKWYSYWIIIKIFKYKFYKNLEIIKKKIFFSNLDIKLIIFLNKKLYFIIKHNKYNILNLLCLSKIKINLLKNTYFLIKFIKNEKCKRCWLKKKYIIIKNINLCKNCYIKLFKQNCRL